LLIPPFASPYADYATAETAIADQVFDCIAFAAQDYVSIATTLASNEVDLTGTHSTAGENSTGMWVSVALKAGSTVAFTWVTSSTGTMAEADSSIAISIYKCDGTLLSEYSAADSDPSGFSGSWTGPEAGFPPAPSTIPADGEYWIFVNFASGYGTTTATSSAAWTIISDDTMLVNPVIALWDDSGTTRRLWACPKLLLPPLTEDSGTWYADCAAADAVLTDADQVSNCVGFCEGGPGLTAFTATDGGTSLTLATTHGSAVSVSQTCWGGVNAEDGETITATATVGAGTAGLVVNIYDDTGTLVESSGSVSSPWTSAALPYTGRYTISVIVDTSSTTTTFSAVISSSGTMSVNEIQARYDLSLTCAATLDCGDACP